MSLVFWTITKGNLSITPEDAGSYVSKQIGLEAYKVRSKNAIDVFKDPVAAVTVYNNALTALEAKTSEEFGCLFAKASKLGYFENQAKLYATKRSADWLENWVVSGPVHWPTGLHCPSEGEPL